MSILSVLLAAARLSDPQSHAPERLSPQLAAERVAGCGAGAVTITSDPVLQEDVLIVAGKGVITDAQIDCIAKAAGFYEVVLPADAQTRLNAVVEAKAAESLRLESTKWLAKHSYIGTMPRYEAGVTNDERFVEQVEKFCKAKGALSSSYGAHVLNPDWVLHQKLDGSKDQPLACVLNVAFATKFELGFIGNEAFAPDSK